MSGAENNKVVADGQFDDPADIGIPPSDPMMVAVAAEEQAQANPDLVKFQQGDVATATLQPEQPAAAATNGGGTSPAPILPHPHPQQQQHPPTGYPAYDKYPPLKTTHSREQGAPEMQPKRPTPVSVVHLKSASVKDDKTSPTQQMPAPVDLPPLYLNSKPTKASSPTPLDTNYVTPQWQIPFSHNYHPAFGFRQNLNAVASQVDDTAKETTQLVAKAPKTIVEASGDAPMHPTQTIVDDGAPFPVVKDDTKTRTFGIQEAEINDVDVLCGRGGMTNAHHGNVHYRKMTEHYRLHYASVKKAQKSQVAKSIVKAIRARHGRFLRKNEANGLWYEIGDVAAKEKTSQTLREGLAKIVRSSIEKDLKSQVAEAVEAAKKREFFHQEAQDSASVGENGSPHKKQKTETTAAI